MFTRKSKLNFIKETGTTRVSLSNADKIKKAGYTLTFASMHYNAKKANYWLTCIFKRDGEQEEFTFNGFSFGYAGEGPNGLIEMLAKFGCDTIGIRKKAFSIEFIEQTPKGVWFII